VTRMGWKGYTLWCWIRPSLIIYPCMTSLESSCFLWSIKTLCIMLSMLSISTCDSGQKRFPTITQNVQL
jgi:hypothetical protein